MFGDEITVAEGVSESTPLLVGTQQPHQNDNDQEGTPTLSHLTNRQ